MVEHSPQILASEKKATKDIKLVLHKNSKVLSAGRVIMVRKFDKATYGSSMASRALTPRKLTSAPSACRSPVSVRSFFSPATFATGNGSASASLNTQCS